MSIRLLRNLRSLSLIKFSHKRRKLGYMALTGIVASIVLAIGLFLGFTDFSLSQDLAGLTDLQASLPTVDKTIAAAGSGKLTVVYAPVTKPFHRDLEKVAKKSKAFERLAGVISQTISLPRDIPVVFGTCNQINAFYDPTNHRVVMCYDLVEHFSTLFGSSNVFKSKREAQVNAGRAAVFVFFHEIGHMLAGELELPITGKGEDAADQFSTLFLEKAGGVAEESALAGATWFKLESAVPKPIRYWGEHSLDMQRFYSIVCLLYGSNPKQYTSLVKKEGVSAQRLQKCEREYGQSAKAWRTLLTPYVKKGAIL